MPLHTLRLYSSTLAVRTSLVPPARVVVAHAVALARTCAEVRAVPVAPGAGGQCARRQPGAVSGRRWVGGLPGACAGPAARPPPSPDHARHSGKHALARRADVRGARPVKAALRADRLRAA